MGSGGVGDPVKAYACSRDLSQILDEGLILPPYVTTRSLREPGEESPGPFTSGSHLNQAFDGDLITNQYNYGRTRSGREVPMVSGSQDDDLHR